MSSSSVLSLARNSEPFQKPVEAAVPMNQCLYNMPAKVAPKASTASGISITAGEFVGGAAVVVVVAMLGVGVPVVHVFGRGRDPTRRDGRRRS